MANLVKPIGHDMLHESPKKLDGRDRFGSVAFGPEMDLFAGHIEQSAIRNADAMGVSAEVLEDVFLFAEGGFCMDDPTPQP